MRDRALRRPTRRERQAPRHTDGSLSDITERKRAEAEHVRLVTAIEQSAEAVVITNTTGDIEYVNPAFTRITGYSREEVLGQNPRILKSDKQDPAFYQQLWATILKGEIWHGELINRRKDGKPLHRRNEHRPGPGCARRNHPLHCHQTGCDRAQAPGRTVPPGAKDGSGRDAWQGEWRTTSTTS